MNKWNEPASEEIIKKASTALELNGFRVFVVSTKEEATEKVLSLIPKGSEVLTNTSTTLNTLGLTEILNESGDYDALQPKLLKMDRATQGKKMKQLRSAPDYSTASVHALTEDGRLMIASGTGSQLPAAAYGANHVLFVVGSQKIVKDIESGIQRIYEHSLPLESERANIAYAITTGSSVNKMLILNKEKEEGRTTVILLKESIGF